MSFVVTKGIDFTLHLLYKYTIDITKKSVVAQAFSEVYLLMPSYLALINPKLARTYGGSEDALALFELSVMAESLQLGLDDADVKTLGGVKYLSFATPENVLTTEIAHLLRHSFVYALFEESGGALLPVEPPDNLWKFGGDLAGILKYSGKTNELFTRLLVNAALSAGGLWGKDRLRVLDLLCGKGTTLLECMDRGFDAAGVEVSPVYCKELRAFTKRFLEQGKLRHGERAEKLSAPGGVKLADAWHFEYARTKDELKSSPSHIDIYAGDSTRADAFLKKNSFDLIVADLPYGVQHAGKGHGSISPAVKLLEKLLPVCGGLLRRGGAMAVSFNTLTLKRTQAEEMMAGAGLTVHAAERTHDTDHRVEQGITRDFSVAVL